MCWTPLCGSKPKITQIRHELSYKQLEVRTIRTQFLCGNRNGHHNTELRMQRHIMSARYFTLCFFICAEPNYFYNMKKKCITFQKLSKIHYQNTIPKYNTKIQYQNRIPKHNIKIQYQNTIPKIQYQTTIPKHNTKIQYKNTIPKYNTKIQYQNTTQYVLDTTIKHNTICVGHHYKTQHNICWTPLLNTTQYVLDTTIKHNTICVGHHYKT